jgi:hypothetical protein
MSSDLVLGVPLGNLYFNLKRRSLQTVGINWFNDLAQLVPTDLTGVSMTIVLGNRDDPLRQWVANNTANLTKWDLDEDDTDLPLIKYGGVMFMTTVSGDTVLFRVKAEMED